MLTHTMLTHIYMLTYSMLTHIYMLTRRHVAKRWEQESWEALPLPTLRGSEGVGRHSG